MRARTVFELQKMFNQLEEPSTVKRVWHADAYIEMFQLAFYCFN